MSLRTRFAALGLMVSLATIPLASGASGEPYIINAILPLTGGESFLGKEEANALTVMETMVNKQGGIKGTPIHFVIADDQSSPVLAVQLANGIVAKKAPIIFGSSSVAVCSAVAPIVAKDGPLEYCFSPGIHPAAGSYVFSAGLSTGDLLLASAKFLKARGWTKIGVITSTDATGQDADRVIAEAFKTVGGITVIDQEHFNGTDVSVSAQMAHIKASNAQALIAWSTGSPFGTLLRGAIEAGLTIPILTSSGNLTYPQMKAYASFMPKELYFPASPGFAPNQLPNGQLKKEVQTYQAAFKAAGIDPDEGYALAWDPALMIVDALKKYGTNATAAQFKEYLDGLTNWTGIWGTHNFKAVPQRGVDVSSVILVRWDPAKNTWIGASKPGGDPL
ncbi:MAG TPA: ABC transporter substrate-binding protein [Candidatus Binatia bacterium]|nr:ABC transporter substrate-binding protein [Candidatus Binatia bacterium]